MSTPRRRWTARSRLLHVLDEDAVRPGGVDQGYERTSSAPARGPVHGNESVAPGRRKRNRHIVNLQGEVVDTLTMLGEERGQVGFVIEGLEHLDRHSASAKEGHPNVWKGLFAAELQAQIGLEMGPRLVDRTDRPTKVVECRQIRPLFPPPLRASTIDMSRWPRP